MSDQLKTSWHLNGEEAAPAVKEESKEEEEPLDEATREHISSVISSQLNISKIEEGMQGGWN